MFWSTDKRLKAKAGGYWRCAVRRREYYHKVLKNNPEHKLKRQARDRARYLNPERIAERASRREAKRRQIEVERLLRADEPEEKTRARDRKKKARKYWADPERARARARERMRRSRAEKKQQQQKAA